MRASIGFVLLSAALLGGCPSSTTATDAAAAVDAAGEVDAGGGDEDAAADVDAATEIDAASDVDAAIECHPAGTYVMTWADNPTNPDDCLEPGPTTMVDDTGLDESIAKICGGPECDASNCVLRRTTPSSCTASVAITDPCAPIPGTNSFLVSLDFHPDGTMDAMATLGRDDGSSCVFMGTGTLE